MSKVQELNPFQIPLVHIKSATNNFAHQNFLARGGFGRVYKGQLPLSTSSSAINVAVKRLDKKHGQGEREFLREVTMLVSYKHDNLVSLVGFCDEGGEQIIVYKYEAHGSLDKHLANKDLTWSQRLRICLDAARGLVYLHGGVGLGHRVLHRDIKSSNILLDESWEAKISDFGLSKIGPTNQQFTFLVTNACGTLGYIDPLYMKTGVLTKESDVYSFGVVLFEVLCGRSATVSKYEDNSFLSALVKHHYGTGSLDEIIFSNLREQMNRNSLEAFTRIAYQCLNDNKEHRPTMKSVVQELETSLELQTNITNTTLWGSNRGGSPWSFRLESYQKLRKIFIDHTFVIYSIAFATEDLRDCVHYFQQHGGDNGPSGYDISQINFDTDEEMIGIQGTFTIVPFVESASRPLITSLCLLTNKKTHGPFGEEEGTRFSKSWDIGSFAGFYGRAGFLHGWFWLFFESYPMKACIS